MKVELEVLAPRKKFMDATVRREGPRVGSYKIGVQSEPLWKKVNGFEKILREVASLFIGLYLNILNVVTLPYSLSLTLLQDFVR